MLKSVKDVPLEYLCSANVEFSANLSVAMLKGLLSAIFLHHQVDSLQNNSQYEECFPQSHQVC